MKTELSIYDEYGTTFSELKSIKSFCDSHLIDDWKEVVDKVLNSEKDFEVNNYRFIRELYIDEIQVEELRSDLYMLGCFNANFLAGIVNPDGGDYEQVVRAIEAAQKNDAYEGIGAMALPYIEDIQQGYSSADGYGHHFAHYDHETLEESFNGTDYYIFRIN